MQHATHKPDAVLIVGAGYLQLHAIRTARSLGLLPLVTDRDPRAPGVAEAERYYRCNTQDIKGHALVASIAQEQYNLRGVMTAGADAAPAVAVVAEKVGAPGIPLEIAEKTHNKFSVRENLDRHDLSCYQPQYSGCRTLVGADNALIREVACETIQDIENVSLRYPVVVKPVSQSASRGISIVCEPKGIEQAIIKALDYASTYMIEECLTGTEHSAEMILADDSVLWFNIVDRIFTYENGTPMECGHINPSKLNPEQWYDMRIVMLHAAQALGVTWGPFKCDVMWTEHGPKILECTARLSGGYDSQGTSVALGCDPTRTLMQLACGMTSERYDTQFTKKYAACAAMFPSPGRIHRLPHTQEAQGLVAVHFHKQERETIEPYEHCATRPGFVITQGETYDEAWFRAREHAHILAQGFVVDKKG